MISISFFDFFFKNFSNIVKLFDKRCCSLNNGIIIDNLYTIIYITKFYFLYIVKLVAEADLNHRSSGYELEAHIKFSK